MSELLVNTIKKADGTGSLTVPAESGTVVTTASPSLGRRNLIINGNFAVWQRGTSASAATGYLSADRFFATSTSLNRSTDTPNGFAYSAQVSNSSGAAILTQAVELTATGNSAPFYNGQSITLSFKAKVPVGTDNVQYRIRYCDIVNGSNPVVIQNTTSLGNGTGSWETYSDTITISVDPAGTSKTLSVDIYLGGASDTSYITGVQLEVGSVATPFEHRSYGEELALCQRYYWKYGNEGSYTAYGSGVSESDTRARLCVDYPCFMRANPTFSVTNIGNTYIGRGNVTSVPTQLDDSYPGKNKALVDVGYGSAGGAGAGRVWFANSATSSSIQADAEL